MRFLASPGSYAVALYILAYDSLSGLITFTIVLVQVSLNAFLLLLGCCKNPDRFSYVQHVRLFLSHQLRPSKIASPGAAAPYSTPLMRHRLNLTY